MNNSENEFYDVVLVSLTYNQVRYIRDALEGFVNQKTSFLFKVVVIDDCSNDGTKEIIEEYEKTYPEIVKGVYHEVNYYSQGILLCSDIPEWQKKAKYVAVCEGDDYWSDPLKLQKQFEFMESHPDYSMCFHNAVEHWEDGSKEDKMFSQVEGRTYSGIEIFRNWIVPTASVLYRSKISFEPEANLIMHDSNFVFYDTILYLYCASKGKVYGMKDVMSVYRRCEKGLTLSSSKLFSENVRMNERMFGHYKTIIKYFEPFYGEELKLICLYNCFVHNQNCAWISIKNDHYAAFCKYFAKSFRISIKHTIKEYKQLIKWMLSKIALRYFNLDLVKIKHLVTK